MALLGNSKPNRTQQVLELPLTILGGVIVGCESISKRWREHKELRKLLREWEAALKGPERFEACAAGPIEWARAKARREMEQRECVEAFSIKLFKLAVEGADAIRKLSEDRAAEQPKDGLDREWFPVFTAFHGFYLHVTDREAFAIAGSEGRYGLMNPLVYHSIKLAVDTILEGMPGDRRSGIKKECLEHLNWSNEEYGQYQRLSPAQGESAEGTAVERLGVEVAELAGRPNNALYALKSQEQACAGVVILDARSYVAGLASQNRTSTMHNPLS